MTGENLSSFGDVVVVAVNHRGECAGISRFIRLRRGIRKLV